ncbi:TetR/AcrR family transcriptional regulator [Pseudothauera rhizosphaerae]|uniref:TetR/AcrR family transcriptional regulator n=1 Tax=Pseudothauera rhizosphaerae TaxID=2565932 RepID=A0A4S4ANP3_9RHOO|nr:TetR/AcrR family transcriptional regulator [Pseudothauera rhizosphaerae]THF61264.1 TetR/AcrR family transcriptional regulator [Pseudothauera rhizosphaerae]
MATPGVEVEDGRILAALALALVDRPRASLQELAGAIGISKTTLYRFCRTREQLIERLINHATQVISETLRKAELEQGGPLEGLRRLLANSLEHRELTAFLMYYWKDASVTPSEEAEWNATLDAFFLRGQQAGMFRIDIAAPALTEIWVNILVGLMDAERRGRVARSGLAALVERAFLYGAAAR